MSKGRDDKQSDEGEKAAKKASDRLDRLGY
jgi:hypothetical protein